MLDDVRIQNHTYISSRWGLGLWDSFIIRCWPLSTSRM